MYFLDFLNCCVFEKLTDRQKRIAMWRTKQIFGIGENEKTYKEIANIEGLCSARCAQIGHTIIRKIQHRISIIQQRMGEPQVMVKYIEKVEGSSADNLPIIYKPVDALGEMTVRTANCLHNEEIKTIEQLIRKKEYELLKVPNFGRKSLNELRELLSNQNLKFGMEI